MKYKELLERYRLLECLMDHIPDVIYFKDKKGRLIMVNQAHARGLGLKPEEVIGKTDFDIHSRERAEKMAKDDRYVMETGKPIIDKIERATRADGVDNYVSTTKIPRFDRKGKIIGLIGITRDITHRMHIEQLKQEKSSIEKKLEAMEELNRMKSEFVSVVSHELRNPLAVIKEALGLVGDGTLGSVNRRQKKLLDTAKRNAIRLSKMIEELLDLSRIESGRFQLRYSLVDLNSLVRENASMFKKQAQEKGIDFKLALPKSHINIFIDAERITQVLSNLINNAVKFTEKGGEVKIELKLLDDKVRIGVLDTGIGISKTDLPKLFDKFVQVSSTTKAKEGVGLGLSIAKELIERHNGEIWAESKLGVGSRFYFSLPRFYTTGILDNRIRQTINELLNRRIPLYLINILIINYSILLKEDVKERFGIETSELFKNLKSVIDSCITEYNLSNRGKPQIAVINPKIGEYGIIFPNTTEKKATTFCVLLRREIKRYLAKNNIKGIFINFGLLSYPQKGVFLTTKKLLVNLYIKKIFIGREARRYRRVVYRLGIEIIHPSEKKETSQTIDISKGGVSFISKSQLEMDAKVDLKLTFRGRKRPIFAKARVAWIKPIAERTGRKISYVYKTGLEFIFLKPKGRTAISSLISQMSKK